jgi:hypothetical protein
VAAKICLEEIKMLSVRGNFLTHRELINLQQINRVLKRCNCNAQLHQHGIEPQKVEHCPHIMPQQLASVKTQDKQTY